MTDKRRIAAEHRRWMMMVSRCHSELDPGFKNYGGRGIKVCDRWRNSFEAFHADMGFPPTPKHSIDRINNDGNYEPENCRWATPREQVANRRNSVLMTYCGRTMMLAEWAKELKIPPRSISFRKSLGWSDHDALTLPSSYFEEQRRRYRELGGRNIHLSLSDFPPGWEHSPKARRALLLELLTT
jgi:hypothetical protein